MPRMPAVCGDVAQAVFVRFSLHKHGLGGVNHCPHSTESGTDMEPTRTYQKQWRLTDRLLFARQVLNEVDASTGNASPCTPAAGSCFREAWEPNMTMTDSELKARN